jgi:hypothetical protein
MYKILRKRGTGKTTSLITLAKENGATLTEPEAHRSRMIHWIESK